MKTVNKRNVSANYGVQSSEFGFDWKNATSRDVNFFIGMKIYAFSGMWLQTRAPDIDTDIDDFTPTSNIEQAIGFWEWSIHNSKTNSELVEKEIAYNFMNNKTDTESVRQILNPDTLTRIVGMSLDKVLRDMNKQK